jgi:N-acylglucosamine 2-epimerase
MSAASKNISPSRFSELSQYYRKHLLEDTLPFWESRIRDRKNGGYHTSFDMQGRRTSPLKSIWAHGRMVWMFSALYNRVDKRREWLSLARCGRDFLLKHAYAGNGEWFFMVDAKGKFVAGPNLGSSIFVMSGLAEYAVASGSDEDLKVIEDTFANYERFTREPDPRDVDPARPFYKGRPMLEVHVAGVLEPVLGKERVRFWRDRSIEKILHVYTRDKHRANFECLGANNEIVDTPRGRTLNPGHTMEALWFIMDEARRLRMDSSVTRRAVQILDWTWARGWDNKHGGIFAYLDLNGRTPRERWGYHEAVNQDWDDKSWWVHCEALVALALAADASGDAKWMKRFEQLHDYCRTKFYSPRYGEWYPSLHRDGRPKMKDHGQAWKWAYHLPRACMRLMQLFEEYAAKTR